MPLISVSDNLAKKSFTSVENRFITKYLPVLEPNAIKIYLFSLYVYQNGLSSYSLEDFAKHLSITEDETKNYFEYLEEFELVSVISFSPFEVKILNADNDYGFEQDALLMIITYCVNLKGDNIRFQYIKKSCEKLCRRRNNNRKKS